MTSAEKDCPCGRGPGHVPIKSAGCTPTAENEVEALVEVIRPWTLCDDGHGFDHGSERAARAVLAAGYRRVTPSVSCGCPVSGFGYRHHRHPCSRAGENEYVIPPGSGDING